MSQIIFFLAILPAVYLGRRYLKEYVAAYAVAPAMYGWRRSEDNPVVETWRRRTIAATALWVVALVVLVVARWP